LHLEGNFPPDHHRSHLLLGGIGNIHGSNILTAPDNGAAFCNFFYFPELMGNENDRFPLFRQVFHDPHQFMNLLRGEDCGRFVKNKHIRIAIEHF